MSFSIVDRKVLSNSPNCMDNIKVEWYNKLSGPRQSCEDMVCNTKCLEASNYRQCKENCMFNEKEQITECCYEKCNSLVPNAKDYCIESCEFIDF